MSNVKRVYVEKKSGFDVQAKELKTEIRSYLGIKDVDRCPCTDSLRCGECFR